jgi:hypothetical protein
MDENGGHQNGGGVWWFEQEGFWDDVNMNIPSLTDVIMGRGHGAATHPGNTRFRITCELHRPRYEATNDKKEKSRIINEILQLVRQTGRFLQKDALTGNWSEAGDIAAKRKIGQVRIKCINKTAIFEMRCCFAQHGDEMSRHAL